MSVLALNGGGVFEDGKGVVVQELLAFSTVTVVRVMSRKAHVE
jgi:hypothetical protein